MKRGILWLEQVWSLVEPVSIKSFLHFVWERERDINLGSHMHFVLLLALYVSSSRTSSSGLLYHSPNSHSNSSWLLACCLSFQWLHNICSVRLDNLNSIYMYIYLCTIKHSIVHRNEYIYMIWYDVQKICDNTDNSA